MSRTSAAARSTDAARCWKRYASSGDGAAERITATCTLSVTLRRDIQGHGSCGIPEGDSRSAGNSCGWHIGRHIGKQSLLNTPTTAANLSSTENSLTDKKPIGYVAYVRMQGHSRKLLKLFPERPRMAIASHVKWNGGSAEFPPLRISQTQDSTTAIGWIAIYLCTIGTNYPW